MTTIDHKALGPERGSGDFTDPLGDGRDPLRRAATASEEAQAAALEATGRYKVLRRVPPLPPADGDKSDGRLVGLSLDIETTGLDPDWDEPLELSMVKWEYGRADGRFLGVTGTFSALQDPGKPISAAVTRLTGLTAADVAGRVIDSAEVAAFVADARIVLAHNARFDRVFCEACWPAFQALPWACSCTGVDWAARGFEGARLGHLLLQAGWYHDAHRALDDVGAMMHLLTMPARRGGPPALAELLEKARLPTARVWAEGAAYRHKGILRQRGYRWSDGSRGLRRAWYRDVAAHAADAEAAFLQGEVYEAGDRGPRVVPVTAADRYSDRAGVRPPAPRASHPIGATSSTAL